MWVGLWPVLGMLGLVTFQILMVSSASGSAGHLFDARLSLRGDCTVSALDEVADPGLCPGTPGLDHPPKAFDQPCGTAVDSAGDTYVASAAQGGAGTGGRIDVFNAEGEYLTQIKDANQPCGLAVDSVGNLYVAEYTGKNTVLFEPDSFPPDADTEYTEPGTIVHEPDHSNGSNEICTGSWSVAVDPSNDHLYIGMACSIIEYGSAAEGSTVVEEGIGSGTPDLLQVAVYGANHDVYSSASGPDNEGTVVVFDGGDGQQKCEIDGSETPEGSFGFLGGHAGIAVDQANGDVYVADVGEFGREAVDQFASDCTYIGQVKHSFKEMAIFLAGAGLAVDGPCLNALQESCDLGTYTSPNEGNLYVAQGNNKATYHLYAFTPAVPPVPPEVEGQAASEITDTEALLEGKLNPGNTIASYRFEYTTQAAFEQHGYAGASSAPVPEAEVEAGSAFTSVLTQVAGLQPGTSYRFRLVASNHCNLGEPSEVCTQAGEGIGETDASFATYLAEVGLPDGRGYELVSPADTNGRIPTVSELGSGFNTSTFSSTLVSPDGTRLVFGTEGGAIPALGGGGYHDTYEAVRDPQHGWLSHFNGLSAAQAQEPHPGGIGSDHDLSFWQVEGGQGSLAANGQTGANYIRRASGVLTPACSPEPQGEFEFVGCGSLGTEPFAAGVWISPNGDHIVFTDDSNKTGVPANRLETCAPPSGTSTIYDHTLDGVTHCVALLPGGTIPSQDSKYEGASADGSAVAFTVQGDPALYIRIDNTTTAQAASGGVRFAGFSASGDRVFWLQPNAGEPFLAGSEVRQGEIFACDVQAGSCAGSEKSHDPIEIGSGDESVLVNVSGDGSHVYFVSPEQLDGPNGTPGADNLYVWHAGSVDFIATLTQTDLVGHPGIPGGASVGGLGLWVTHAVDPEPGIQVGPGSDPSRSSPDGSVLVFESQAKLGDYDNAGHREIYRYDAGASGGTGLQCVSCNPTGAEVESDAQLQSDYGAPFATFPPVTALTPVANLAAGGQRVFFQSADRLALGDADGKVDVYEWEAEGSGTCQRANGCIYLISSGHSGADDHLYAVSPDGGDVFFESGDLLVAQDQDSTPSIYDAREGGGFPPPPSLPPECSGEACQPQVVGSESTVPASARFTGPRNPRHRCPKSKAKARRRAVKKRCGGRHKPHGAKHKGKKRKAQR